MSRHAPRVVGAVFVAVASLFAGCAAQGQLRFDTEPGPSGTPVTTSSDGEPAVVDAAGTETATGDPAGDDPASVEAALGGLLAGWTDCFHAPAECDPTPITADGSPERTRLAEAAAHYAAEQIRTKPDEGRLEWGVEALSYAGSDRARVVACEYDTRVFFDSSMAHTELGDIIFDTTIWTRRVEWTLARDDDAWKLWSRRVDRRSPVARFCAP